MPEFREYIEEILNNVSCPKEEKEDLKAELFDHLMLLKEEYLKKGYDEKEAVDLAIKDFGNKDFLKEELKDAVHPLTRTIKILVNISFGLYSLVVIQILINPIIAANTILSKIKGIDPTLHGGRRTITLGISEYPPFNLVPFRTIYDFIIRYNHMNFDIWFYNLFGNIILFLPLGFMLPLISGKLGDMKLRTVVKISALASLTIEILQLVAFVGIFDVDDIILNLLGAVLGYYMFKLAAKGVNVLKQSFKETSI
ncbi:VanZ family protein [Metallumcola ferriviriculae]|uniref:VanZ family protein n=1 Tax=Metallumcola ferriviriculae TaxID=3039180 RepID=A0AAU0UT31_9FIRM|nr:VanZ family protein [Desulfitibacteraceae bacterium MK1]